MGVRLEGPQEQAQRLLGPPPRAQLAREGQPGPPVPRVLAHQALAQGREARGLAAGGVRLLQGVEGEVGPLRGGRDRVLEDPRRAARVALEPQLGEGEVGGEDAPVERQRGEERLLRRVAAAGAQRLPSHLRLEEAEHEPVVRLAHAGEPRLDLVGLAPLPLVLVELLLAGEGVEVPRVHVERVAVGLRGAVEDARLAVVGAEAREGVGALGPREVLAREQRAVDLDRALHLPDLAVEVAQHLLHLDRVRVVAQDLAELVDGGLELPRGEAVQALGVVGRGAEARPLALARLPAARHPRAPRERPGGGGEEDGDERGVRHPTRSSPSSTGRAGAGRPRCGPARP